MQTNIKVKFLLVALFVSAVSPMPCSTLFFNVVVFCVCVRVVVVPLLVPAYEAIGCLCNSDVYSAYSAATVTFCLPNHFRLSHPCFMYHFEFILTLFMHLSSHSIHLIWYDILPMLFFSTFPLLLLSSICFFLLSLVVLVRVVYLHVLLLL